MQKGYFDDLTELNTEGHAAQLNSGRDIFVSELIMEDEVLDAGVAAWNPAYVCICWVPQVQAVSCRNISTIKKG